MSDDVNVPVPLPLVVLLFVIVGLVDVDQHTPRADIVPVPTKETTPPDVAVVVVIADIAVVWTVTVNACGVMNETWLPYDVVF